MKYGPPDTNPINFYGNSEMQIAARQALPILIQLATDSTRPIITYGELAVEIGMEYMPGKLKNPIESLDAFRALWMRRPLGCIWQTLFEYQQESNMEICTIPYLTTIVVNKGTDVPTIFRDFNWSDEKIRSERDKVYKFEDWTDVLEEIMSPYES
ncbi:MAG: hypothetical protein OXN27_25745 [Candidatus Poribacteria bacterium]|nr:hypothetical protein [Candidatus Poribacteria bacterium]